MRLYLGIVAVADRVTYDEGDNAGEQAAHMHRDLVPRFHLGRAVPQHYDRRVDDEELVADLSRRTTACPHRHPTPRIMETRWLNM